MKKLNMNSIVRVRLNDLGKEIYYHRYDDCNEWLKSRGAPQIGCDFPDVDEGGFSEFQLWDFMSIFGPHIGMGKKEFWTDFNLYIDDEDLDEV